MTGDAVRHHWNDCSGRGEMSRTDATDLNVPVPLALKIELMGAEQWIGGSTA